MSEEKRFRRGLSRLFGRLGSKSDQRQGSPATSPVVPETGDPSSASPPRAVPTTLGPTNPAPANHEVVRSSSGGPTEDPGPERVA
jgi:hypothetical protein